MVEQPLNNEHRRHMETVFKQATDKLAEEGIHLTQASAQAIWWWPEKLLWERMGVAPKKQDTDYLKSLKELAAKKGVKLEDAVMDAMSSDQLRKAEDIQWKYRHLYTERHEL